MADLRTMCRECPWRNPGEEWKQPIFERIAQDVADGAYLVHACHNMTDDMIPASEKFECPGHRRHLIELGVINDC